MAMKMTAACATDIGGLRNKENQDTFFIKGRTVGVFDGHGSGGRIAAEKARDIFAAAVEAAVTDMTPLFAVADAAVVAAVNPVSGTTATILQVAEDGACTVSHVGDAEAFVFDSDEGPGVPLGVDHSPCSLDEWTRVRRTATAETHFRFAPLSGGMGRPVFVAGTESPFVPNPAGGHMYCNVRHDWAAYVCGYGSQLGITRALGDFNMKPHGVISSPDVVTAPAVATTGRAIVVASDGLWDAMLPEEVRAIVRKPEFLATQDAAGATAALMAAAMAKGCHLFGKDYDNVTAVVVYVAA